MVGSVSRSIHGGGGRFDTIQCYGPQWNGNGRIMVTRKVPPMNYEGA